MELITKKGELNKRTSQEIAKYMTALKSLKEKEKEMKEALLKAMEENGILKFDNDYVTITYVAETERETFDKKKFQEDNPELYDDYISMSVVKPSVRIKCK